MLSTVQLHVWSLIFFTHLSYVVLTFKAPNENEKKFAPCKISCIWYMYAELHLCYNQGGYFIFEVNNTIPLHVIL